MDTDGSRVVNPASPPALAEHLRDVMTRQRYPDDLVGSRNRGIRLARAHSCM